MPLMGPMIEAHRGVRRGEALVPHSGATPEAGLRDERAVPAEANRSEQKQAEMLGEPVLPSVWANEFTRRAS